MSIENTPKRYKVAVILMWIFMLFSVISTFFCYWLINDDWAMIGHLPYGTINAGFQWALDTLDTLGLLPIIFTVILIIDHIIFNKKFSTKYKENYRIGQKVIKPYYNDKFRIISTICLTFVSLPWIFALIGIFIGDIPGLNFFMSKQQIPWENNYPAVHLGMHHGYQGFYICISIVLISYCINWIRIKKIKSFVGIMSNMVLYLGIYSVVQDFMNEQFYNSFRLNGIDLPILNLIPFDLDDPRIYIVIAGIIIAGILTYFFVWKKKIEIN
ncbi:MAG: hypothetical protein ACTSWR_11440 [Candidatus Helarchaeota archaeon]